MTKKDIAGILDEIATLLELKGENPFKVRAYQAGARVVEGMEEGGTGATGGRGPAGVGQGHRRRAGAEDHGDAF